jgi:hypothetical protein
MFVQLIPDEQNASFKNKKDEIQSAVLHQYLTNLLSLKKYPGKHRVKLNEKEIALIYINRLKEYKLAIPHKEL